VGRCVGWVCAKANETHTMEGTKILGYAQHNCLQCFKDCAIVGLSNNPMFRKRMRRTFSADIIRRAHRAHGHCQSCSLSS
jgi:hypothetical protein